MNCPADLTGNNSLLGVQITLNYSAFGHQHLGPDAHGSTHPSFYPYHTLCLQVPYYCHIASYDREWDLVGAAAPEFVAIVVTSGVAENPHQLPSLTMVCGSNDSPSRRISKCRCGAVERPLLPVRPITWLGETVAPDATKMRERCPYMV